MQTCNNNRKLHTMLYITKLHVLCSRLQKELVVRKACKICHFPFKALKRGCWFGSLNYRGHPQFSAFMQVCKVHCCAWILNTCCSTGCFGVDRRQPTNVITMQCQQILCPPTPAYHIRIDVTKRKWRR